MTQNQMNDTGETWAIIILLQSYIDLTNIKIIFRGSRKK